MSSASMALLITGTNNQLTNMQAKVKRFTARPYFDLRDNSRPKTPNPPTRTKKMGQMKRKKVAAASTEREIFIAGAITTDWKRTMVQRTMERLRSMAFRDWSVIGFWRPPPSSTQQTTRTPCCLRWRCRKSSQATSQERHRGMQKPGRATQGPS